jgi:hypothetical protein
MKEEFEKWVVEEYFLGKGNLWKKENGEYGYFLAENYWKIWQAGYYYAKEIWDVA